MNRRDQNRAGDSGVSFGAQAEVRQFRHRPFDHRLAGIERGWHLHHLQLAGAQAVDDLRERGDFVTLFGRGREFRCAAVDFAEGAHGVPRMGRIALEAHLHVAGLEVAEAFELHRLIGADDFRGDPDLDRCPDKVGALRRGQFVELADDLARAARLVGTRKHIGPLLNRGEAALAVGFDGRELEVDQGLRVARDFKTPAQQLVGLGRGQVTPHQESAAAED